MMSMRKTVGILLAASLGFAGNASAQNLDLDEVGALLSLPVITGNDRSGALTAITVTNAGADAFIHVNVISGDEGEYWKAQDFTCEVTASETVLFVFEPDFNEGSLLSYECGGSRGSDGFVEFRSPLQTQNGIMVVTVEDEFGNTMNTNQIFGDAVVLDYSRGSAFSVSAIPFQGVVPSGGVADRKYRFDNVEYSEFPSALATNFIAPTSNASIGVDTDASLILFTLDGTVGSNFPPEAALSIKFYNDDEVQFSTSYHFDCFSIVDLLEIDDRFAAEPLGSDAGHMVLTPEIVTYTNLAHDSQFDGGEGAILGVRIPPVHGWIFQHTRTAEWGCLDECPSLDNAAWGRTLAQSQLPVVTSGGDVPVLNAP